MLGCEDLARRRASLGAVAARTDAVLHFLSVRAVSRLERDDPALALAVYRVVAAVTATIANRLKLGLARATDANRPRHRADDAGPRDVAQ